MISMSACSSEGEHDGIPDVAEPVSVAASDDTKRELGVVVWGAQSAQGNDFRIAGYGADGRVALVVEQKTVISGDSENAFVTTLSSANVQARMRLEGRMTPVDASGQFEIKLEMAENTFQASPVATNALVQLQKDLEAAASGAATTTSLVSAKGIAPMASSSGGQQLVEQRCTPLLRSCAGSLVRAGKPLVPCAMALVQAGGILLCGVAGFFAGGPVGALQAGAVCGIRGQGSVIRNGMECAERASDIYNNMGNRLNDVGSTCSSAASGCTGGGSSGVATSSL